MLFRRRCLSWIGHLQKCGFRGKKLALFCPEMGIFWQKRGPKRAALFTDDLRGLIVMLFILIILTLRTLP